MRRRTEQEIQAAQSVEMGQLKDPEADADRVKDPEWYQDSFSNTLS